MCHVLLIFSNFLMLSSILLVFYSDFATRNVCTFLIHPMHVIYLTQTIITYGLICGKSTNSETHRYAFPQMPLFPTGMQLPLSL